MLPFFRNERDDDAGLRERTYLSHSRVSRYLLCPEQFRFYYLEHLRPIVPPASLVFGQIVHQALAHFFQKNGDPVRVFREAWLVLKDFQMNYNQRESWEKLSASGEALLQKFVTTEAPKIGNIRAAERPFKLSITTIKEPFIGVVDLYADLCDVSTVIDFKTSSTPYDQYGVGLSDQLTAYKLAEPGAVQVAFCVLVKTKEPKIEWRIASRSGAQLMEYIAKAGYVAREIAAGAYHKRSGAWCSWCDYLPLCLDNQKKARETLIAIE